ncbi:MAG: phosphatidylglycerophosphatase A [Candidatus Marinimicrobia bacterium]|jgi:phosphatidylglycerophosphatase A|nr:phosphatidylglycerophosphatase A [Candidatus Neomarinimicrobiota bacterium]MBT3618276.1 phosphatidylglycerophosphatase A [Candidatus Neomarinimicrobiota bacterium]MBT3828221.1 phosphatidylglycerophosphatase A [Candidatus Neomarinimicrobiota bacterium]MBT3997138.1 phosphatidylglycerophosphatase A [Candidatus Neomarinimicrobiota bacterium]MBT4280604.1 phosphatidylglycerophosphatase A [Candidatus Neomarinimicrobiota bacterium]
MKWGFPEWIASVVGIGKLPFAPGTWGSLFAILSWFYFGHLLHIFTFIGLILSISLIGKRVSDSVVKRQSQEDPSFVVIDELAGQWVAVIGLPIIPEYALGAFVLFRVFDIIKPGPIKDLEKLKGGLGVMADDLAAGLFVLIILHSIRYFTL